MTTETPTDPVTDPVLDVIYDLGVQLAAARRDVAAMRCPTGGDADWVTYWAALGSAEGRVAELYDKFAELDPTDTDAANEAAAQAANDVRRLRH